MANIWVISDTHFGHANTFLKFKLHDGTPMRPFTSVEEMDEMMVQRWNEVVRPPDKVYHLGDCIVRWAKGKADDPLAIVGRLNGRLRLVLGNHDKLPTKDYLKHFDSLYASREIDHVLLTHIPVHPDSLKMKIIGNVHGHIHNNTHRLPTALPCPPYLNVCVEVTDYRPVAWEDVKARLHG